ncbi:multi-sensor hybrid histidine kinase [Planoprotostelium fungivorum]|uniref:Multi-sensor hybrid histidine kinase n=1 Tax=Planoprotostelium fungivorum TaxID=1890364 RepID=A0A2P6NWV0_9EUKA|nr:multi-sensor hybrid histidine kinase [Planoprotostelium fungivorum]
MDAINSSDRGDSLHKRHLLTGIRNSDHLDKCFWDCVSNCLKTEKPLKKQFESPIEGQIKFYSLRCKFTRTLVEGVPSVLASIRGKKHDHMPRAPSAASLDEIYFLELSQNVSELISQTIMYDPTSKDMMSLHATAAWCKMFKQSPDKVTGVWLESLGFGIEQTYWWGQQLVKHVGASDPFIIENWADNAEAGRRYIRCSFYYVDSIDRNTGLSERDKVGAVIRDDHLYRFIAISADLTNEMIQKEQVEETNRINQLLRLFFDTSPTLMTVLEPVDDTTLFYHFANTKAAQAIEYLSGGKPFTIGSNSKELGISDDHIRMWVDAIRHHSVMDMYDPVLGEWFRIVSRSIGSNRYSCVATTVTHLKSLEEELRKNQEHLEQMVQVRTQELNCALEVKSRFLATMSHEIRTPLSAIIGTLELLFLKSPQGEMKELLQIGKTCADQLLIIINDILDLSKIEAGGLVLDEQVYCLESLIESCIEVVSVQAKSKDISLVHDSNIDLSLLVNVDGVRLRQVIINLLGNAVKFTSKGHVLLKARTMEETEEDVQVEISVEDTGIGISEEFKSIVFTPFTQSDFSITRKYGGTGLGLSICKRIAQLMGGDISFTSREGYGTQFTFTVRLKRANTAMSEDQDRQEMVEILRKLKTLNQEEKKRIVICYSCPVQSSVLQRRLEALGFTCDVHTRSEDVGNQHASGTVILMDERLHHPSMREMCTEKGYKLIITGHHSHDDDDTGDDVKMLNGNFKLSKPVRWGNVLRLLHTIYFGLKETKAPEPSLGERRGERKVTETELTDKKILLAEDNPLNQKIISRMLQSLHIDVDIVGDGVQVIEKLKETRYHLILMDCMMPIMGGIECTEYITQHIPEETRPVIVALTADAFEENTRKCLEVGMKDTMTKPVKREQLYQTIKRWCSPKET